MRYEDASQTGSISELAARDDAEHLAGNDFGPATGNIITGTGTVSGAAGTDLAGADAQIIAIAGAGGADTSFDASGKLEVAGQYGTLTIDANGNYTYVRNPGSPDAVSDTFTYTLANSAGATDTANLVVNIGNIPMLQAEGSQTVTTNNGVIVLPAGVQLSDVRVVGRDLVITLPDGSTMVIPDGAVFVPQLVIDGVEVPASNLAALLIDSEPKPAAGDTPTSPTSGGGNFALPPGPLDPGVPLGDLIPPTELDYTPPEFDDIFPDDKDNDPPFIGASAVNVSEEGVNIIAPAIPDTSGSPDTTNSAVVGGTISVGDPDGDPVTVTLGTPAEGLTSQGVPVTWSVSGDGHTLTGSAGGNTVITVVINNAGVYTVTLVRPIDHPTGGGEQGSSFVVPVSASDGEEVATGGTITVIIEDDSPVVSNVTVRGGVTLDETDAGTPAGFPISATTDGPIIANSSGGFGADGPAVANATVYGIGLTGGVSSLASGIVTAVGEFPITLVQIDGDTIQGQYTNGGTQVAFIIQMNGDGSLTLTQNVALEHNTDGPPGPAHDDVLSLAGLVNATVTLTDRDGDVATGSAPIGDGLIFRDDGPDAAVNGQAALDTIVLDETRPVGTDTSGGGAPTGVASGTANFADNFVGPVDYGADGPGSVSYSLLLSANGIASGLFALQPADTTAGDGDGIGQGASITLSQVGNTITGSAGGTDYFTISIDANTGIVTFTQLNPIWHPTPGASYDEAAALNTAAASNLQVVQTVTDADGDTDTASINIGQGVFSIQDDGPDASVFTGAALDTLALDETRPAGTDTSGGGAPTGLASITANFADNFNGPADFGADGAGSVVYSLNLSVNGLASGLYALQPADDSVVDGDGYGQGASITLSQVGNTVTGSAGGTDYFTISINPATGVVTFTQLAPIWHPTPGASYDEAAMLSTPAAANLQVVQTITDADGDTDSAAINVGQGVFSIQDDGPSATNEAQQDVQEGNQTVTGTFDFDIGEDGGGLSHINGTLLTFGGDGWSQWIAVDDGQIRAQADGDYEFQTDANGSGVTNGTFTVTDNDGDTASGTWAFNVTDANGPSAGTSSARLDDDGLAGGNAASTIGDLDANVGEIAPVNPSEAIFHGQLALDFGGDGPGTVTFAAMHGVVAAVGTENVTYSWNAGTSTLTAVITGGARNATTLFDIVVNQTTGEYTLTLRDNVLHSPGNDENDALAALTFTVTDSDNSPAGGVNGTLNITFDDDAPSASVNGQAALDTIVLDETRPVGTDTSGGGAPTGVASGTANFADNFTAVAYGADGPGSTVYSLILSANGIASGLFALQPADTTAGDGDGIGQGASITLSQVGNTITGSAGGTDYFTITIAPATGVVTFTQLNPIWHPTPGASYDEAAVLNTAAASNIQVQQTVTDADGDVANATINIGQGVFSIQDDGPDASLNTGAALDTIVLDETRPVGTDTAGGGAPNGVASGTANFADNFNGPADFGADGAGSVVYSLNLSSNGIASGLFALQPSDISAGDGDGYGQGASITLSQTGNTVTGSAGGTDYFTISINPATGVVTFTQLNPIWHPTPGASFDETATLSTALASNLQVVQTITDADGDVDSAAVNVGQGVFSIQDDGPRAIQPDAATLNNEIGASVTADLDDDGEVITDFGADGAGLVQFANISNGADSGFDSGGANITYWLSNNGQTLQGRTGSTNGSDGTLIFSVQINQGAGDYTVTMFGTVDNGAGVSFNNLTSTKAGNVDVRGVGADDPATTVDLLLTASGAGGVNTTINTSSSTVGSANQSMDQGETVRIDFVTNLQANAGLPSGFSYDGHVGTNSLIQAIPQVQGNQAQTVAFQVYALNTTVTDAGSPDDYPGNGFSDATIVNTITHVTIDGFGVGETPVTVALGAVGVWTTIAYGVSAQRQADGSVIFTGVQEGDQYGITTGTDFNAFAVTSLPSGVGPVGGVSTTNSFDLGVFAIGSVDTGEPVELSFDLRITDADGDTIVMPGAIDITLNPEGTVQSLAAAKTSGPDTMEVLSSHSLLVSETQEVERVAANSNTIALAAAVAAAGVSATSAAASTPGIQDGGHAGSLKAFGGPLVMSDHNVGDQPGGNVSGFNPLHGGGFELGAETLASTSHNAIAASHFGELAAALPMGGGGPNGLLEASDLSAALPAMPQSNPMFVAMPVQSLALAQGGVEQIIADALNGGGSAPSIDALLSALPGQGLGDNAGLDGLATQIGNGVPNGDMGHGGVFTFDVATIITSEAMVLHHDAVQPVANG